MQVWAADDYEIFKRMMIQKNIDLQMEALELLQQRFRLNHTCIPSHLSSKLNSRYGVLPESLQPSKESPTAPVEGEDKVMQEVTRLVP